MFPNNVRVSIGEVRKEEEGMVERRQCTATLRGREAEWHSSPPGVQTPPPLWKSRENMSNSCSLL